MLPSLYLLSLQIQPAVCQSQILMHFCLSSICCILQNLFSRNLPTVPVLREMENSNNNRVNRLFKLNFLLFLLPFAVTWKGVKFKILLQLDTVKIIIKNKFLKKCVDIFKQHLVCKFLETVRNLGILKSDSVFYQEYICIISSTLPKKLNNKSGYCVLKQYYLFPKNLDRCSRSYLYKETDSASLSKFCLVGSTVLIQCFNLPWKNNFSAIISKDIYIF